VCEVGQLLVELRFFFMCLLYIPSMDDHFHFGAEYFRMDQIHLYFRMDQKKISRVLPNSNSLLVYGN